MQIWHIMQRTGRRVLYADHCAVCRVLYCTVLYCAHQGLELGLGGQPEGLEEEHGHELELVPGGRRAQVRRRVTCREGTGVRRPPAVSAARDARPGLTPVPAARQR